MNFQINGRSVHPQIKLLRLTAGLVLVAWISLVSMFFSIACGAAECSKYARPAFAVSAEALILFVFPTVLLAALIKCPHCNAKMLRQNLQPKHPSADKIKCLDYWSTAIIRVILGQPITCMYCGKKYLTRN